METVRTVPAEAPIGAGALLPARVAGSRQVIRSGLLAGLTGAFVASIGMLVSLSGRLVVKQFSLDYVILAAIPVAFGYLAAKPPPTLEGYEAPRTGTRSVAAGAAAGALAGLVMAVYLAIVGNFNLREVFPNISPDMVKRLTFGLGLPAGAAVLFLASTALAALGGGLNLMSGRVRKAVTLGLMWRVVVGAGLLDLGYVAFFAVGAYTTAVLMSPANPINSPSKPSPQLIFWEAIPFVVLAAAVAGILVGTPVLRMRGDYLAIVTLGFG